MDEIRLLKLKIEGDSRGNLVAIEGEQNIPFDIKRIFYIYGMDPQLVRGQHANRRSEFVMICVAGSCKVKVTVPSGEAEVYELNQPDIGLYLPRMTWKDMYDFSDDAVLICLANEHYDSEEYIRDYDEFLKKPFDES